MIQVPEDLLDRLLETEASHLATNSVRAVSMHEVLGSLQPHRASRFMIVEIPKRFAVRIRMIENLHGWQQVPELQQMRDQLHKWFREIRLIQPGPPGYKEFTACAKRVRAEGKDTVKLVTSGLRKLHRSTPNKEKFTEDWMNKWLDDFLMLRIGTNMLLDQFTAICSREDGGLNKPWGIVDKNCDATQVCEQAAQYAMRLCEVQLGRRPRYYIESYSAGGCSKDGRVTFTFIPTYLRFILLEVLKNSFYATLKMYSTEEELEEKAIRVLVCNDPGQCAIRISDRAGGIPHEIGGKIWSYLYGAAARSDTDSGPEATPLSGFGVGVPISRLHARYLGGKLRVQSFPGYGTDAYLNLPTIITQQVESIPE